MGLNHLKLFSGVFDRKKVLVTGDTGFKGSWLAIWLNELGANVYGYSLPPRSALDNYPKSGLHNIIHHTDGDIRDGVTLEKYIREIQPDFVFHLAAQSLVLESYQDPRYTFETNIIGTVNVFEAVRNTESVKVLINVTSDKCYQNNNWVWGYRENDPMGGNDPYSASKGCSELITNSYNHSFFNQHRCHIASVRAGNVIGGGDWAPNRIVADFFRAIMENQELILRNPHSVRPWQFVLEPLSGYLMLCSQLFKNGKKFSGAWNFGPRDASQHQVQELIEEIVQTMGKGKYKTERKNNDPPEANMLNLDISKAVNILKWSPVLNFHETVKFTIDGYQAGFTLENTYQSRAEQIKEYVDKAMNKKADWTRV
ncbi:MAG: CDP-glucose 4,6-dehydratase [Bacteroidota bacterium]